MTLVVSLIAVMAIAISVHGAVADSPSLIAELQRSPRQKHIFMGIFWMVTLAQRSSLSGGGIWRQCLSVKTPCLLTPILSSICFRHHPEGQVETPTGFPGSSLKDVPLWVKGSLQSPSGPLELHTKQRVVMAEQSGRITAITKLITSRFHNDFIFSAFFFASTTEPITFIKYHLKVGIPLDSLILPLPTLKNQHAHRNRIWNESLF